MITNFLLFGLLFSSVDTHNIQVAYYTINQYADTLTVDFVFEDKDLSATFAQLAIPLSTATLQSYLEKHFALSINDELTTLSYGTMEVENKHIYLTASTSALPDKIQSLTLHNTCLLSIDDHSNIIEVKLHGKDRDFLMNTHRTSLKIDY